MPHTRPYIRRTFLEHGSKRRWGVLGVRGARKVAATPAQMFPDRPRELAVEEERPGGGGGTGTLCCFPPADPELLKIF